MGKLLGSDRMACVPHLLQPVLGTFSVCLHHFCARGSWETYRGCLWPGIKGRMLKASLAVRHQTVSVCPLDCAHSPPPSHLDMRASHGLNLTSVLALDPDSLHGALNLMQAAPVESLQALHKALVA